MWPTPTFKDCQGCGRSLFDRWCPYCGWRAPEPNEAEITDVREQDGKLWIDLHHTYIGSEYNYDDPIMLGEDDAQRLRDQLDFVLRERRMPHPAETSSASPSQ